MEIKKVRREGEVLKITIPKKSGIKEGDYVFVTKIDDPNYQLNSESLSA